MAVEKTKRILQASVGSDEQLAEAVESSDIRALRAIQTFLKTVSDANAVCGLSFDGEEFEFHDPAQVKRSHDRLGSEYIDESEVSLSGQFLGLFPVNPRVQFKITGGDVSFPEGEDHQVVVAPMQADMIADLGEQSVLRLALEGLTVRVQARSRTVWFWPASLCLHSVGRLC